MIRLRGVRLRSDFQTLLETREHSDAAFRQHHDIFQPHAAEPGIIKTWLNGQHLSWFENGFLEPWILVNLKPEAVPGPVKKSDLPALAHFGRDNRGR